MNEEEKKAIEKLKKKIERADKDIIKFSDVYTTLDIHNLRLLLNLIEKQHKEIEELKENELDYTTIYMDGVYDGKKNVENKIREKIKEYQNKLCQDIEEEKVVEYENIIQVLQELLQELLEE